MYWALKVEEGRRFGHTTSGDLHITSINLDLETLPNGAKKNTQLWLEHDGKANLCATLGRQFPNQTIDIAFRKGEAFTVFTKNAGDVYIHGYVGGEDGSVDEKDEANKSDDGLNSKGVNNIELDSPMAVNDENDEETINDDEVEDDEAEEDEAEDDGASTANNGEVSNFNSYRDSGGFVGANGGVSNFHSFRDSGGFVGANKNSLVTTPQGLASHSRFDRFSMATPPAPEMLWHAQRPPFVMWPNHFEQYNPNWNIPPTQNEKMKLKRKQTSTIRTASEKAATVKATTPNRSPKNKKAKK